MNYLPKQIVWVALIASLLAGLAIGAVIRAGLNEKGSTEQSERADIRSRSDWRVQNQQQAIRQVFEGVGVPVRGHQHAIETVIRPVLPDSAHERTDSTFTSFGGRDSNAIEDHHRDEIEELSIQTTGFRTVDDVVIRWTPILSG